MPDARVQHYLNAADAVVLPYRDILSSGAVILAMSFARACVAPRLGDLPELLGRDSRFLYDPTDQDGLSQALLDCLDSKQEVARAGEFNRCRAQGWNWDLVARKTREVYEHCLVK